VLPVYGFTGGGKTLKDAGAIFADDLNPQKARILLMLVLQAGVKDTQAIQKFFDL
jgi:L-asparaginase